MSHPNPNNAIGYFQRGKSRYDERDYEGAISDFSEAVRLYPEDERSLCWRANAREKIGDFEGAIADFDRAIELDPDVAWNYIDRGRFLGDRGEFDRAIADFETAEKLKPQSGMLRYCWGRALVARGDLDAAYRMLTEAVRLERNSVSSYVQRAYVSFRKEEYEDALSDLDIALQIDPECDYAYYLRGRTLTSIGNLTQSVADFTEAIRLNPDDAVSLQARANARHQLYQFEAVLEDLHRLWQLNPHDACVFRWIASLLASCPHESFRNGAEAVQFAITACDLSEWKDMECLAVLAAAHAEADNIAAGIAIADRIDAMRNESVADESAAEDAATLSLQCIGFAVTLRQLHLYERALRELRRAVELDKESALAQCNLAAFLSCIPDDRYRDGEQAIEAASKACDLTDWRDWYALSALAAAYAETDQLEKAVQLAERAIDHAPEAEKPVRRERLALYESGGKHRL